MIGSVGFLLFVSLVLNSLVDIVGKRLTILLPQNTVFLFYALNTILVFLIITILFLIIYKSLPDGKIAFRDGIIGAAFTAFLFMLGKFAIGLYLKSNSMASVYGAAGSIILILAWVYYSAIILYFGAEFTKVYANIQGKKNNFQ